MNFEILAGVATVIATLSSVAVVVINKVFNFGKTAQRLQHIEEDIKGNIKPDIKELKMDVAILKTDFKLMAQKLDSILEYLIPVGKNINRGAKKKRGL